MYTTRPQAEEVGESLSAEREPTDSEVSVVFKGDGEPKTSEGTMRQLNEMASQGALEQDAYSRGGTVEKLERKFSEMLGTESTIFMPTGTLANHLAIRKHCGIKPRAITQEQGHLYNDTGDCVPRLSGINLVPLAGNHPYFTLDELKEEVTRSETGRVANPVGAVLVESPVRRQAGQIVPFDEMKAITDFCKGRGIPTHLDGARLYMMSAATGVCPKQYAALFDTTYVSLYKYFGAPFGAILAGTSNFIEDLYHERRMFGGGLVSSYLAAALAIKGTENFEERFSAAMTKAGALLDQLNMLPEITVERFEHGSNIFPVELSPAVDVDKFLLGLRRHWVFLYRDEADPGRILLTVNTTLLRQPNEDVVRAFEEALAQAIRS